jgi:hypothetical protein
VKEPVPRKQAVMWKSLVALVLQPLAVVVVL